MKEYHIFVHVGAGIYNKKNAGGINNIFMCSIAYKLLINEVFADTLAKLHAGISLSAAVQVALSHFEQSSLANAGYGSALTHQGTIEMDACIIDGTTGLYGAVAALRNIATPSAVAYRLLQDQLNSRGNTLAPALLCGEGAHKYAIDVCHLPFADNITLISPDALLEFQRITRKLYAAKQQSHVSPASLPNSATHKSKKRKITKEKNGNGGDALVVDDADDDEIDIVAININNTPSSSSATNNNSHPSISAPIPIHPPIITANNTLSTPTLPLGTTTTTATSSTATTSNNSSNNNSNTNSSNEHEKDKVYDTVGVIIIDNEGNMSCGASSGGTPLRHIGRIGPVACYGSGIYCRDYLSNNKATASSSSANSNNSNNGKVVRNIIGSCTSGTGEHIMQTLLANNICNYYNLTNDEKTLIDNVSNCFGSIQYGERQAGFITAKAVVTKDEFENSSNLDSLSFIVGLSAPTIIYGFQSSKDSESHFHMLDNSSPGEWIYNSHKIV